MNEDEPFQRATTAALRLLSYRPRSEAEVRGRLLRRFPSPLVEQVVSSLKEQGLLDDRAFARFWQRSRDSFKPRSAALIRRELVSKGVAREIAEEALCESDDRDSAYRAGLKGARRLEKADLFTFRRKCWAYLQRRGFSPSVIRHTLDRIWEERGEVQQ